MALTLDTELFLTTDARQAQLAKAEGLEVVSRVDAPRVVGDSGFTVLLLNWKELTFARKVTRVSMAPW